MNSTEVPDPVRRALDVVTESNMLAIRRALEQLGTLSSPAYAVGLEADDLDEVLTADVIFVGVDVDRQRALAQESQWNAFRQTWDTNQFATGPIMTVVEETAEFSAAREVLVDYAESHDQIANRLVLNHLARLLTESPPVSPRTEDFVAYLFEEGFSDDLIASLNAAATSEVAAARRAKHLLPESDGDLEGAPRFW